MFISSQRATYDVDRHHIPNMSAEILSSPKESKEDVTSTENDLYIKSETSPCDLNGSMSSPNDNKTTSGPFPVRHKTNSGIKTSTVVTMATSNSYGISTSSSRLRHNSITSPSSNIRTSIATNRTSPPRHAHLSSTSRISPPRNTYLSSTNRISPPRHAHLSSHKQLSKLKRFLATLQQFGNQISPDIGERVQYLVLALVSGSMTIETFHDRLQDATNFPLRPFVIPFLKTTLPILQNDLFRNAQSRKMTPQQYLLHNDHFLLTSPNNIENQNDTPMDLNVNGKRPHSERTLDLDKKKPRVQTSTSQVNRLSPAPHTGDPFQMRGQNEVTSSRGMMSSPSHRSASTGARPQPPNGYPPSHRLSPAHLGRFPPRLNPVDDNPVGPHPSTASPHRNIAKGRHPAGGQLPLHPAPQHRLHGFTDPRQQILPPRDRRLSDREWIEDCKQMDYLLTYIVDLVEKARQCLHLLHRNFDTIYDESVRWRRLYEEGDHFKRRTGDFLSETEKRMSQARKQAEEELVETKRRMVAELERAASSDPRAELLMARRQVEQEVLARVNKQEDSHENCWNCGRKAQETCSGCNLARYCGSFCQHKDWENHHKVCGPDIKARIEASKRSGAKSSSPTENKRADSAPGSPAPSSAVEKKPENTSI